jgi:hypothetical protein
MKRSNSEVPVLAAWSNSDVTFLADYAALYSSCTVHFVTEPISRVYSVCHSFEHSGPFLRSTSRNALFVCRSERM